MTLDLIIPFGILLALVIYLIYTRNAFEKRMLETYEEKYENWKKTATLESGEKKESPKELVGLVFKKDAKITVELFDEHVQDRVDRGKFNTKVR